MPVQINLRKANALQKDIKDAMRALDLGTTVMISEFEEPEEKIAEVLAFGKVNMERWTKLSRVLFEIRKKVAHANVSSGISDALADVAEFDERISRLGTMLGTGAKRLDTEVLRGRLDKMKNAPTEQIGYHGGRREEGVTTSVLDEEHLTALQNDIKSLKLKKREVQDTLLGLNVATKFDISDAGTSVLTEEKIVSV
jgi:hypothetical protein